MLESNKEIEEQQLFKNYFTATTSFSAEDLEFFTITPELRWVVDRSHTTVLQQKWQGTLGTEDWQVVPLINLRDV
jgi:hypothetical protein